MRSPCTGRCLDVGGYCEGCLRTLEEVRNWASYTDEERLAVLRVLKERRRSVNSGGAYVQE